MKNIIITIEKGNVSRIVADETVQVTIIDNDNPSIETVVPDSVMTKEGIEEYFNREREIVWKKQTGKDEH